ncbi:hypothetical protein E3N88_25618 [Mikania micrantha]|uniref:Gelsolin-like domain-containing protein n=1 Tax=Mikania micrantha TaxID=192012 RepID=A0A5N6N6U6_9ASTR|nr:hypothetical protein E3N88_25618 [Mikania micrantha]
MVCMMLKMCKKWQACLRSVVTFAYLGKNDKYDALKDLKTIKQALALVLFYIVALLKQPGQGVGPKGKEKNAPVAEYGLLMKDAIIPVACADIGNFYSGDCYIVLYSYHSREKKEDFYLCYWIGKDSTKKVQNVADKLTTSMFNSLKRRPVQISVSHLQELAGGVLKKR